MPLLDLIKKLMWRTDHGPMSTGSPGCTGCYAQYGYENTHRKDCFIIKTLREYYGEQAISEDFGFDYIENQYRR